MYKSIFKLIKPIQANNTKTNSIEILLPRRERMMPAQSSSQKLYRWREANRLQFDG